MRLQHETIGPDVVDTELIELKFVFDRGRLSALTVSFVTNFTVHHDNRDITVLPSYQPRFSADLTEQTHLYGKHEGVSNSFQMKLSSES